MFVQNFLGLFERGITRRTDHLPCHDLGKLLAIILLEEQVARGDDPDQAVVSIQDQDATRIGIFNDLLHRSHRV